MRVRKILFFCFCSVTLFMSVYVLWRYRNGNIVQTDVIQLLVREDILRDEDQDYFQDLLGQSRRAFVVRFMGGEARQAQQEFSKQVKQKALGREAREHNDIIDPLYRKLFAYQGYIPSRQWKAILDSLDPAQEFRKLLIKALSSIGGIARVDLSKDPYLLTYSAVEDIVGLLPSTGIVGASGRHTYLIDERAFAHIEPWKFVANIDAILEEISEKYEVSSVWTGYQKFAASSAQRLKGEVQVLGFIAFIFTLLSQLILFKGARPIFLTGALITVGLVWGAFFTILFQNSIHIVTLGFGAGLMGVSVDYSLHYFCEQLVASEDCDGWDVLSRIIKAITAGMITSSIVFALLAICAFPGLRELGIFSVSGLGGAYLSVLLIFPFLAGGGRGHGDHLNSYEDVVSSLQGLLLSLSTSKGLFCLGLLTIPGLLMISFDDDVKKLQSVDSTLLEERQQIFVEKEPWIALRRTEPIAIKKKLFALREQGEIAGFIMPSDFLPSVAQQKQFRKQFGEVLESHAQAFEEVFTEFQVNPPSTLNVSDVKPLSPSSVGDFFRELGVGVSLPYNERLIVIIGIKDPSIVYKSLNEDIVVLSSAEMFSSLLEDYRNRSSYVALLSYVLVFGFLVISYGRVAARVLILPSLLTAVVVLSILGLLGVCLNFFHILSLIIVMGLSVDYSIFFYENSEDCRAVAATVLLSTLSTVLAFGLLSLSSALVLRSIGITIGLGVLVSTVLAPMASSKKKVASAVLLVTLSGCNLVAPKISLDIPKFLSSDKFDCTTPRSVTVFSDGAYQNLVVYPSCQSATLTLVGLDSLGIIELRADLSHDGGRISECRGLLDNFRSGDVLEFLRHSFSQGESLKWKSEVSSAWIESDTGF